MDFNDRVAALLSVAVYVGKEAKVFEEKLPKGWSKRSTGESTESGFFAVLVVKVCLPHFLDKVCHARTHRAAPGRNTGSSQSLICIF